MYIQLLDLDMGQEYKLIYTSSMISYNRIKMAVNVFPSLLHECILLTSFPSLCKYLCNRMRMYPFLE